MTHRFYLNDDWLFTEQFEDSLAAPEYPENTLQSVRLPHTCKETPFHYFDESLYQMVSGYRRHLQVPADWQGNGSCLLLRELPMTVLYFVTEKRWESSTAVTLHLL